MNCYCNQILDIYGLPGLNVIFEDGQQYCKTWHESVSKYDYQTVALACWIAFTNIIYTVIFAKIG